MLLANGTRDSQLVLRGANRTGCASLGAAVPENPATPAQSCSETPQGTDRRGKRKVT